MDQSVNLIEEPFRSAHLVAIDFAEKYGCVLSYDPILRPSLRPSSETALKGIMSVCDQSDITKVNVSAPFLKYCIEIRS